MGHVVSTAGPTGFLDSGPVAGLYLKPAAIGWFFGHRAAIISFFAFYKRQFSNYRPLTLRRRAAGPDWEGENSFRRGDKRSTAQGSFRNKGKMFAEKTNF